MSTSTAAADSGTGGRMRCSHLYDSQQGQQDGGGWVRSICVATFDVGTGHTLEEVSGRLSSGVPLPYRSTYRQRSLRRQMNRYIFPFAPVTIAWRRCRTRPGYLPTSLPLHVTRRSVWSGCCCVHMLAVAYALVRVCGEYKRNISVPEPIWEDGASCDRRQL